MTTSLVYRSSPFRLQISDQTFRVAFRPGSGRWWISLFLFLSCFEFEIKHWKSELCQGSSIICSGRSWLSVYLLIYRSIDRLINLSIYGRFCASEHAPRFLELPAQAGIPLPLSWSSCLAAFQDPGFLELVTSRPGQDTGHTSLVQVPGCHHLCRESLVHLWKSCSWQWVGYCWPEDTVWRRVE